MKTNKSIQLKSAFLMVVFSMNTIIGFACAIGINMGFNSTHNLYKNAREVSVHVHTDGKKHFHHDEAKHHEEQDNEHHKAKDNKGNCCNDKVIKFIEVDKSASHSLNASINPIFFTSFFASFYEKNIFYTSNVNTNIKFFVRSHHPPIPDIRIAIRSFQI